jgi:hypothetical protein
MDRDLLLENIVSTVKTAKAFDLPIVHSTINAATGRGHRPCRSSCSRSITPRPIDRTTTNAWQDADFVAAVHATGRPKLILCAPLDRDLHGIPGPRRAAGGLRGLPGRRRDRRHQRGGPPRRHRASRAGRRAADHLGRLAVELQRDWAREETVADVIEIVLTDRLLKA